MGISKSGEVEGNSAERGTWLVVSSGAGAASSVGAWARKLRKSVRVLGSLCSCIVNEECLSGPALFFLIHKLGYVCRLKGQSEDQIDMGGALS